MLGICTIFGSCEKIEGSTEDDENSQDTEEPTDNDGGNDNIIKNVWKQTGYEYLRTDAPEYNVTKDCLEGEEFWEFKDDGKCRMGLDKVEYCDYNISEGSDGNKYLNISEEHFGKTLKYSYKITKISDTEFTLYINNKLEDGGDGEDEIRYSATRKFKLADDADTEAIQEKIAYKEVDLGLSVNWAETNLSASSPEEIGGYFSWTEAPGIIKERMGEGWRMPTMDEFRELYTNCSQSLVINDGKYYIKYTSKDNKSIMLPFGGYFEENDYNGYNRTGRYWSGDLPSEGYADHLEVSEDSENPGTATSSGTDKKLTYKMTIRAVKKK